MYASARWNGSGESPKLFRNSAGRSGCPNPAGVVIAAARTSEAAAVRPSSWLEMLPLRTLPVRWPRNILLLRKYSCPSTRVRPATQHRRNLGTSGMAFGRIVHNPVRLARQRCRPSPKLTSQLSPGQVLQDHRYRYHWFLRRGLGDRTMVQNGKQPNSREVPATVSTFSSVHSSWRGSNCSPDVGWPGKSSGGSRVSACSDLLRRRQHRLHSRAEIVHSRYRELSTR